MADKKKAVVLSELSKGLQFELILLDTPIVCKCGHETTRRECRSEPVSFIGGALPQMRTNYFCPNCGEFVRCDSAPVPLLPDDNADENEDSDYDEE